jgi:predicted AlkP superfamily pyrophosphatase or phosphodiesterase
MRSKKRAETVCPAGVVVRARNCPSGLVVHSPMMRRAVLNVVGLTARDLAGTEMPRLATWARGRSTAKIRPAFPAVTCTAQADYLTGQRPSVHGIVANGWHDRALGEVHFWKQSNRLVGSLKVWDVLRAENPGFRVANLFWWYNMGSTVDIAVTPRPIYCADGAKFFDIASYPQHLRPALKAALGDFPFHTFWGPKAGIGATQWIADCARWIETHEKPDLSLVYLPHLDYDLQRFGPNDPRSNQARRDMDTLVCDLIDFLEAKGIGVTVLSEYGITAVDRAVPLNRILRSRGWLEIKDEQGHEVLDYMASRAFAVVDHQIAHVTVHDPAIVADVKAALEATPGVGRVLDASAQRSEGIAHPRAGDLIAIADDHSWFSYPWWEDDSKAPDYARTVDIHRKPGYDPCELFLDPELRFPVLKIAGFLLRKKLGLRALLEVIPLDASLVKGSHGRIPADTLDWPVLIGASARALPSEIASTDVFEILLGRV